MNDSSGDDKDVIALMLLAIVVALCLYGWATLWRISCFRFTTLH